MTSHTAAKPIECQCSFFQRQSDGRFTGINSSSLGPYFETKRLGRALVRVDANRDQRVDLLVTNLFDPTALLINTSDTVAESANHVLTLHLVATESHRDAIGTRVTVEAGGQFIIRQLLAGDGYQCSNERCLRFSLGDAEVAEQVTIFWPSGRVQKLNNVQANAAICLAEGHAGGA